MTSEPLVSVVCVTYNHELCIAQTIEGFLKQRTTFPVEIIIGEDCSTDRTREICLEYRDKNPDKLRLILSDENVGPYENFLRSLTAAKGKYIAYCDGDDYWTDPEKLQKQADFLEANPSYAICFHNCSVEYDNGSGANHLYNENPKDTYSFIDLAHENIIATGTCMFRNHMEEINSILSDENMLYDDNFHLLNAEYGLVKFLPDVMSVYRIHSGGTWSQDDLVKKAKRTIPIKLSAYNYYKNSPEKKYFLRGLGVAYFKLADAYLHNKLYLNFLKYNYLGLFFLIRGKSFNIKRFFKVLSIFLHLK